MEPLDIWIEYVYSEGHVDKYLIVPEVEIDDDIWNLRPIKFTVNTEVWSFYPYPKIQIYSYLFDTYNVVVF